MTTASQAIAALRARSDGETGPSQNQCSRWLRRAVIEHFGNWQDGLTAAGLRPLASWPRLRYDPLCTVKNCRRPHKTGGYCARHAERLRSSGQLELKTENVYRLYQRFWKYVLLEDVLGEGCWIWRGPRVFNGYGIMHVQGGGVKTSIRAHRFAYEAMVGPIPEELTIDHLCRVRDCVNPAHLEPVTIGENVRRGVKARAQAGAIAPVQLTTGQKA